MISPIARWAWFAHRHGRTGSSTAIGRRLLFLSSSSSGPNRTMLPFRSSSFDQSSRSPHGIWRGRSESRNVGETRVHHYVGMLGRRVSTITSSAASDNADVAEQVSLESAPTVASSVRCSVRTTPSILRTTPSAKCVLPDVGRNPRTSFLKDVGFGFA